jgi:hypothetical protein
MDINTETTMKTNGNTKCEASTSDSLWQTAEEQDDYLKAFYKEYANNDAIIKTTHNDSSHSITSLWQTLAAAAASVSYDTMLKKRHCQEQGRQHQATPKTKQLKESANLGQVQRK